MHHEICSLDKKDEIAVTMVARRDWQKYPSCLPYIVCAKRDQ